jgi:hypothetical protein
MQKFIPIAVSAAAMLFASAAAADPVRINDPDEGYSRLARWEQHLDDSIANAVERNTISPRRAWQLQKQLDSVEARVLQSYYESNNGIDPTTFRRYASELRGISNQLGENDWGSRNVYGNGWYDDRGPGYGGGGNGGAGYGGPAYGGGDNNPPPPPSGSYYRQGDYERSCHQGNAAAGTIFGAVAGGLIGGAEAMATAPRLLAASFLAACLVIRCHGTLRATTSAMLSMPMGAASMATSDAAMTGSMATTTGPSPRPASIGTAASIAATSMP